MDADREVRCFRALNGGEDLFELVDVAREVGSSIGDRGQARHPHAFLHA